MNYLDGLGVYQFEPIATLASLRFTLVEPHPVDSSSIFFTHTSNNTMVSNRGDNVGIILGSSNSLVDLHFIRILE